MQFMAPPQHQLLFIMMLLSTITKLTTLRLKIINIIGIKHKYATPCRNNSKTDMVRTRVKRKSMALAAGAGGRPHDHWQTHRPRRHPHHGDRGDAPRLLLPEPRVPALASSDPRSHQRRVPRPRLAHPGGADQARSGRCGGASRDEPAGRDAGRAVTYPAAWDKTKNAYATPLRDELLGNTRPALLLLLGAGILLLLMACANVAALVLARTTDRTHEMSLRAALGAGRGRLARQIVTESLAFSLMAGGLGLLVATLGFGVLVRSLPLQNGFGATVALDWTAFAAAFLLSVLVGLGVAAAPVRDLLRGNLKGITNERGSRGLGDPPDGCMRRWWAGKRRWRCCWWWVRCC